MLKSQELKVGIFAALAIASLIFMFFTLNPNTFDDTKYHRYFTILENASGIVKKTQVKTNGITVGTVSDLKLQVNATRVEIEIDSGVIIPVGSTIEVRSTGFLGDRHLEIVRNDTKILRPDDPKFVIQHDGFIPQADDSSSLEALVAKGNDIANDIKKITSALAGVLGTEEGQKSVQSFVDNVSEMSSDLKETTETLRKVIGERDSDLNDIVTNIRDGVADLREFSSGLKDIMDDENRDRIDRILASFDETMADVKGGMRNVNLIAEKVERGEGTIGRLINDDDALAELEGAIKDIRNVLAPATKLRTTVDYHMEARADESTQHYFNIILRTRPDRFYLLGATDTSITTVEKTTVRSTGEEGEETSVEKVERQESLRFNLQFAKRWYSATLRFGLFETTGGIAADLHLFQDRVRFTAEAFDWDTQSKAIRRTAHLKTYASVLFYNHIYVMAGIDDPTRTDPETGKVFKTKDMNYFMGAGLTFDDEDLKAIFGTAALAL